MSSHSRLSLRSVAEIAMEKLNFFIPDYQRGYRWEKDQVTELLTDLAKFFELGNPLYCLQPLVVIPKRETSKGKAMEEGPWEVIDGQQRLTTLFLILWNLGQAESSFQIRYQRHGEPLMEIIKELQEKTSGQDKPDFHYLRRADRRIKAFLRAKPEAVKLFERLSGSSEQRVSFIWYQLPPQETSHKSSIDAFTRLNAGKIPLTDVELIRALFLRSDAGLEEPERLSIATVWDQMEKRLNEDEFWGFATPDGYEEPVNRIELVLHMVVGRRLEGHHQLFHAFEARIRSIGPREAWLEVEQAFSALEEWHDDHALFHLVGYLSNARRSNGIAVWDLYSSYWTNQVVTKDRFKKALVALVKDDLVKDGDVRSYIERLRLPDPAIKRLLLCFNLATLLTDAHGTVRFSFNAFREQKKGSGGWDVEHIHAAATGDPEGKDLDGFLEMYHHFFKAKPTECQQLLEKLTNALDPETKTDTHAKKELCTECRDWEKKQYPGEELQDGDDRLANLALLDSNTNRGFKNASFRVKRAWILDPERQHIYVPPCTRNVFTKSYTPEAADLLRWNLDPGMDGDLYVTTMAKVLTKFFEDADSVTPVKAKAAPAGICTGSHAGQGQGSPDGLPGSILSFLELLDTHGRIEIPLIQRDYAQGRKSAQSVRHSFLDSIFDALQKGEALNLDFVYGTIRKAGIFEPIDGQQRLTTLFLLHWAVFWKAGKLATFKERLEKTGGFRYRVRPAAERFFPALLEQQVDEPPSGKSFLEEMPQQLWFPRNWLTDPTVRGALVMLDAMRERLSGLPDEVLADPEAHLGKIKMEVLVLPGAISPDEIYLKMNARGKPLTDFEKFKAWLVGLPFMEDDWKLRLDQEWLEFFWEKSEDKENRAGSVSACFFNSVLALAINRQAGLEPAPSEKEFGERINGWIHLDRSYRKQEWTDLFDAETTRDVLAYLDDFHRHKDAILELMKSTDWTTTASQVIKDPKGGLPPPEGGLSFMERCKLHAVALFCRKNWEDRDEWFRLTRNLISNIEFKSISELTQTIRSLNKLAERMESGVLTALSALKDDEMADFKPSDFREQLEEERIKARLLNADPRAWAGIRDAERHPFLRGQIGVLLLEATGDRTTLDAGHFAKRWEIFAMTMDRAQINPHIQTSTPDAASLDRLVIRAVLAKCDAIHESEVWLPWMKLEGSREGGRSWKEALKRDARIQEFRIALLRVIDHLAEPGCHGAPELLATGLAQIARSIPPAHPIWMKNLIALGEFALRSSTCWLVKRYHHYWVHRQRAFFVFSGKIRSDVGDLLIGEEFEMRNSLLAKLVDAGWSLSGASEECSGDLRIFYGHHPELRRHDRRMVFYYQSIELDEFGQKQLVPFMDGANSRSTTDVLKELKKHGMPI